MSNNFEAEVFQTIRYFSFFSYPPNFEEIYTFLKKKLPKKHLANILEKMKKNLILIGQDFDNITIKNSKLIIEKCQIYTLPQYSIHFKNRLLRQQISQKKLRKIQLFLKILSWFPQIKLIGLSGTVAMLNAQEKDDIDLFVITTKNRLFTARLITIIISSLLGLRRSWKLETGRWKDKACLNLFFDETNLRIPKFKQTEYVAHEILQMKPLINKERTYEKFLAANSWVFKIFPNACQIFSRQRRDQTPNFLGNVLEFCLKKLQLTIIKQHQTNEIVTNTQLWFFPEDFEKRITVK